MNDTALQLGFDGAIKLLSGDSAGIDLAIEQTRATYLDYARAISPDPGDRPVYWRIVFALLSVHSPIHATFDCYRALRLAAARHGRPLRSETALMRVLRSTRSDDGVLQYIPTKARYIATFTRAWRADSSRFTRNGDTDEDWRARIQANVLGLGIAKASFAVALCNPVGSTVCCIDSHMHALFTGQPARKEIKRAVYLAIEDTIRAKARQHGLGTFVLQWLLWDAKRGVRESHSVLAA